MLLNIYYAKKRKVFYAIGYLQDLVLRIRRIEAFHTILVSNEKYVCIF